MPIAVQDNDATTRLAEEEFRDERELQGYLELCPYLLMSSSEPEVVTVRSEVGLPAAGTLDLLLVDQEGVPVAVEVKLARNSQSRREVVAQAFDYVSDLDQLTVDELDDLVGGALMDTLRELEERTGTEGLRKQCGTNPRAGRIKLVVAVDEAGGDLIRIIQYINDHSDLDMRLVTISKFEGGRILVPRILVSGGEKDIVRWPDPDFIRVVETYSRDAPEALQPGRRGRTYRKIRPEGWPGTSLHYEFCSHEDAIGVELHLESDEVRNLAERLEPLAGTELAEGVTLEWDSRWSKRRGRLMCKVPKGQDPALAAGAMEALICLTLCLINRELSLGHGGRDAASN